MLSQIVQARVATNEKFSILQRFDVKIDLSARRRRLGENLFDDVRHRDDAFGSAELVDHDRQSLWMREKKFEQIEGAHRFRNKRRCEQRLGVMFRRIE